MRISSYNILDITTNEYIGMSLTNKEVEKLIGLYHTNVSKYPCEELLYKKDIL